MDSTRLTRREFVRSSVLAGTAALGAPALLAQTPAARPTAPRKTGVEVHIPGIPEIGNPPGAQRLSLAALKNWEAMKFGAFFHFGMSTFVGAGHASGDDPSTAYAPDRLDVDQWVSIARDAGMKYAVLTTKHVAGHCLWPTKHNDYHVGTSGNRTDVVTAFLQACERRDVKPGFYYSSWDNHNRFGSVTPRSEPPPGETRKGPFVTPAYLDFQWAQITELMDNYGPVAEWWIDIPNLLPRDYRQRLYDHIAARQPETVIVYNHGIGDGSTLRVDRAWPTDVLPIERFLPNSATGHLRWRNVEGADYYIPGEVCDPIGAYWFCFDEDQPRPDAELLGMYLTSVSRHANFLLDVGPDKRGLIPERYAAPLTRLRKNIDRLGL